MSRTSRGWLDEVDRSVEECAALEEMLQQLAQLKKEAHEVRSIRGLEKQLSLYRSERLIGLRNLLSQHVERLRKGTLESAAPPAELDTEHLMLSRAVEDMGPSIAAFKERFLDLRGTLSSRADLQREPFRRLLIPTDLSDNARRATDYAITLFGKGAHRITLLHVVETGVGMAECHAMLGSGPMDALPKAFATEFDRLRRTFGDLVDKIEACSVDGVLVERMDQVIKEREIDLVVMGTHGDLLSDPPLFGTNTSRVIAEIDRPVLVVPRETPFLAPQLVVFAADQEARLSQEGLAAMRAFKEGYATGAIALLIGQRPAARSGLQPPSHARQRMHELGFADAEIDVVRVDEALGVLERYMTERSVDLLTIITRRGKLLPSLFNRPSGQAELMLHSHIPVLVLHAEGP